MVNGLWLKSPLRSMSVGTRAKVMTLEGERSNPAEVARWSLSALAPVPGYATALAIEGSPAKVLCAQPLFASPT